MTILERFASSLVKTGRVILITADGRRRHFGPVDGSPQVTVRLTDNKVGLQIARNPPLGFGEAYMDGRLLIEEGTLLELLQITVGADMWEVGTENSSFFSREKVDEFIADFRRNGLLKSKHNVAHHYDLSDDLYDLFLDDDRQYSCAYYHDPASTLERPKLTRRPILQPSSTSTRASMSWISARAGVAWRFTSTKWPTFRLRASRCQKNSSEWHVSELMTLGLAIAFGSNCWIIGR